MNFPIILFLQNVCAADHSGQQLSLSRLSAWHIVWKNAIFYKFMSVKIFQNNIENV